MNLETQNQSSFFTFCNYRRRLRFQKICDFTLSIKFNIIELYAYHFLFSFDAIILVNSSRLSNYGNENKQNKKNFFFRFSNFERRKFNL